MDHLLFGLGVYILIGIALVPAFYWVYRRSMAESQEKLRGLLEAEQEGTLTPEEEQELSDLQGQAQNDGLFEMLRKNFPRKANVVLVVIWPMTALWTLVYLLYLLCGSTRKT